MRHRFPALRFVLGGSIPLLLLSGITAAAPPPPAADTVPVILVVRVMDDLDTLEIDGSGFGAPGAPSRVSLGGDDLTSDCAVVDATQISCIVSGGLPAPGDYLLVVAIRAGKKTNVAGYDLTIGGSKGEPGEPGPSGETGATGPTGPTGSKGDPGSQGEPGATGATGSKGDAGNEGEAGAKGETGATGSKGDAGTAGTLGATGVTGPTGPPGTGGGGGLHGMKKFTDSGATTTWIVPSDVTHVLVEAWGAGGGGAAASGVCGFIPSAVGGGGGGGAGAYSRSIVTVTPSSEIAVTPGTGGSEGVAGGDSTFGSLVIAKGGSAGAGNAGGPGGAAEPPPVEISASGGAGSNGTGANCSGFPFTNGSPGSAGAPTISPYGLSVARGGGGGSAGGPAGNGQAGLIVIHF